MYMPIKLDWYRRSPTMSCPSYKYRSRASVFTTVNPLSQQ